MTDREAIGIIITERDLYCPKKRYEAFDKAISALREREDRNSGCEFCDGSERSMLFRIGACAAMNDEVYVSGDAIIIDFGCKAYDTVKIGFCPMCGRKLKGEDN